MQFNPLKVGPFPFIADGFTDVIHGVEAVSFGSNFFTLLGTTFTGLKGLSHEIFWPVFWPVWLLLGLNVNRLWF